MKKHQTTGPGGSLSRRDFLRGVAGTSVAGVFARASATAQTSAPQGPAVSKSVVFEAADLPILARVDAIVIGGSLAGVAAALEFARAGRKAIVIEHRSYLGREIAATLRPWIVLESPAPQTFPESFSTILKTVKTVTPGRELPLRMDAFKLAQEDLLLQAGVQILYCSLPTELLQSNSAVAGVVIGNKSGRQAILGSLILDTSATAVTARVAGAAFEPPPVGTRRFVRTLEFDKVEPLEATTLAVPAALGIAGEQIQIHRGYRGNGHILIECPLDLPADRIDPAGAMAREIEARERTLRLATHLIQNVPAFGGAVLGVCGYELDGPQTTRLTSPAPAWVRDLGIQPFEFLDKRPGPISWPLSSLAGPVRHQWILGEASRLHESELARLHDPINAALVGAALARHLLPTMPTPPAPAQGTAPSLKRRPAAVRFQQSPQRGAVYEWHPVPASAAPIFRDVDVLVAGGGTSGATAGGVAAREGMRTVVLEHQPGLGGTGTIGGVNSYWFGRRCAFARRNSDLVAAVHRDLKWTKAQWSIEGKMGALLRDVRASGAEVLFNTLIIGTIAEGSRVRGVVAATPYGPMAFLAKVTIDATGDGDVAAFAGAESTYGSAREHIPLWFRLGVFTAPGVIRSSFTTPMDTTNIEDITRALLVGRRRGDAKCHDHVAYATPRESRHIRGDVLVTLRDQLRQRRWPDVVNVHSSNTDIKGLTDADIIRIGLIPPIQEIELPYRALLPRGLEGILVAGKAFSADHDTFTALRMQSDLENLGGVVALAAAQAAREGTPPRAINIEALQRRLVQAGILTEDQVGRHIQEEPLDAAGYRALLAELEDRKLYEYCPLEWPFGKKIPFVELCAADPALAVPILEEALAKSSGERKLLLAQALALVGSRAGVPALLEEVGKQLAGEALPPRANQIPNVQLPPDQAACPDVVYLIYALGLARDARALAVWRRVADLLTASPEDFKDPRQCVFYYVDAVSFGAERLGDPAAAAILRKIHAHPALKGQTCAKGVLQSDIMLERRAILEVGLGYALARCQSREGYEILTGYLTDYRAILAEYAHDVLVRLTGHDAGKDAREWLKD